jgi:hypothetical protein
MKLVALFSFLLSAYAWACPPCPSGASYTGTFAATSTSGCRCTTSTATWDGSACVEPAAGCSATTRTWLTNCGGSLPARSDSQTAVVSNTNVNYTGSATYTCNNGTWSAPTSTSCTIKTCTGGAKSWLTNCSATAATINAGASTTISNTNSGYSGSATYACNDGTWGAPTSTSCTAAPSGCSAVSRTWSTNCGANLSAAAHGAAPTVSNTNVNYTGSATFSCDNGTWQAPTGTSCAIKTCSSGSRTWSTNCSANVPTTNAGSSAGPIANTAVNYTGSATFACNDGTWAAPTGTSCTIKTCAGGSRSWLTNCSANVPATNAGSSAGPISNTASGYTGSATFACNDGTWAAPTSTSCTANPACNQTALDNCDTGQCPIGGPCGTASGMSSACDICGKPTWDTGRFLRCTSGTIQYGTMSCY